MSIEPVVFYERSFISTKLHGLTTQNKDISNKYRRQHLKYRCRSQTHLYFLPRFSCYYIKPI